MSKVRASSRDEPSPSPTEGSLVRIGELARRTGVPASTLRAWERRYGVIAPERGESGYRLYDEDDERRLRRMVQLVGSGLAPAEAARLVITEAPAGASETAAGDLRPALASAVNVFDERGADLVLDRAVTLLSVDALLDEVCLPVLRGLENGTVGQEHFASNLIRSRLTSLARGWGAGGGRLALLACPEGELHDLGLVAFGLSLRARGWRISFLGANTPIDALAGAASEVGPELIVLSAFAKSKIEPIEPSLRELADRHRVLLAGPGSSAERAERVGAGHIAEGPVGAASAFASA